MPKIKTRIKIGVTLEEWQSEFLKLSTKKETLTKEDGWLTVIELAKLMDVVKSTARTRLNLLLADGKAEESLGIRKQINGRLRKTPVFRIKK